MEIRSPQQLVAKMCQPCKGGVAPCTLDGANAQLQQLADWRVTHDGKRIRKDWTERANTWTEVRRFTNG
jgi:4a-hydroxytetrahydrobiopterin dehydratase